MLCSNPNVEIEFLPPLTRQRRPPHAPRQIIAFIQTLHQHAIREARLGIDDRIDIDVTPQRLPGKDQGPPGKPADVGVALAAKDVVGGVMEDDVPVDLRGVGVDPAAETVEFPGGDHFGSVPDVGIPDRGPNRAMLASETLARLMDGR